MEVKVGTVCVFFPEMLSQTSVPYQLFVSLPT